MATKHCDIILRLCGMLTVVSPSQSLLFCTGEQFFRDSIRAFNNQIKIRENRKLSTINVFFFFQDYRQDYSVFDSHRRIPSHPAHSAILVPSSSSTEHHTRQQFRKILSRFNLLARFTLAQRTKSTDTSFQASAESIPEKILLCNLSATAITSL